MDSVTLTVSSIFPHKDIHTHMCILSIPTIIFADFESIEYYWLNYVTNVLDDSFILASMHAIWPTSV